MLHGLIQTCRHSCLYSRWGVLLRLKALQKYLTQGSQKWMKIRVKSNYFSLFGWRSWKPPRAWAPHSHAPAFPRSDLRARKPIGVSHSEAMWGGLRRGRRDRTHREYFIGARAHAWCEPRVQGLRRAPGFFSLIATAAAATTTTITTTGILLLLSQYHPSAFNNSPASEC